MKHITILIILITAIAGAFGGYILGSSKTYTKAQADLAIEITQKTGEFVNSETNMGEYEHFKDIENKKLYVHYKNGVKTIAIWDDKT